MTNQSANIKWQNPTLGVQYPHTVTFIRADSNLTIPKISFNLSNYSSLIDYKHQNAQNDLVAAVDLNTEILPTVISAYGSITNLNPYGNIGGDVHDIISLVQKICKLWLHMARRACTEGICKHNFIYCSIRETRSLSLPMSYPS